MTPLNVKANRKLLNGDPINNAEVRELLAHYTELTEALAEHGDIYTLLLQDVGRQRNRLKSYFDARGMN